MWCIFVKLTGLVMDSPIAASSLCDVYLYSQEVDSDDANLGSVETNSCYSIILFLVSALIRVSSPTIRDN